jgi:DNA-binding PadR family transcriptional regulator
MTIRRLQEPSFLVLTALAGGARHGYALLTDIASLSEDAAPMRAGTLYAVLDRLTNEGLVEVDHEEVVDGRLRRYYRLSGKGAERLGAEIAQMRAQAAVAARRLRVLRAGTAPMSGGISAPPAPLGAPGTAWA